ncbi:hypothetical protein EJ03DRAFT_51930 [Teratosphaeria nubilosa]|uniref:Uncharacterized protein n=1 Tax=Teratosphaeria nubilosa TaxID=161662 RepID=A0A6G1LED7_9PEZI|nr:hypothetical protein EJ03DRAFT_51930 [Teratosphaeria nubilosa]
MPYKASRLLTSTSTSTTTTTPACQPPIRLLNNTQPNPTQTDQTFTSNPSPNMPLVVPGLQSNNNNSNNEAQGQTSEWLNKLTGKKIGEQSNETVRSILSWIFLGVWSSFMRVCVCIQTFAKTDLPKEHRILKEGDDVGTLDHKPERLNIHTAEDGTVLRVTHG